MNDAHLHLIVNHLPIVGVLIGILVLIAGLLFKKSDIKLTALGILIFSSIMSAFAFYTGEGAEEVIEDIAGISETLIHEHEEMAESFFILTLVLGALALLAFIVEVRKHKYAKYFILLTLALAIADGILGKFLGTSGGEIRHPEISNVAKAVHLGEHDDD